MTQTMKVQMLGWRRRTGLAALGAAVAMAGILGPETPATTRLGAASEVANFATVTAADTITSTAVLAEVAADQSPLTASAASRNRSAPGLSRSV